MDFDLLGLDPTEDLHSPQYIDLERRRDGENEPVRGYNELCPTD